MNACNRVQFRLLIYDPKGCDWCPVRFAVNIPVPEEFILTAARVIRHRGLFSLG